MIYWEWYRDDKTFRVFLHLLLTANHEPKKWQGIMVEKGQKITSYGHLAEDLGLGVQSVRTSLNKLKSTGEITIKNTTKYSVITILKWDDYQSTNTPTNKQLTNNQQTTNNKQECKEGKNEKKGNNAPPEGDIEKLLNEGGRIQHDYQFIGLDIFEKTGAPENKKGECIRIAKKYPKLIDRSLSFCLDYPNQVFKWKMFLWKLNQLIKNDK